MTAFKIYFYFSFCLIFSKLFIIIMSQESVPVYISNDAEWANYKRTFNKVYAPDQEIVCRQKWHENIQMINNHNQDYKNGKVTYTMGVNQFADGTQPSFGLLR
jgi:hypothetical protein